MINTETNKDMTTATTMTAQEIVNRTLSPLKYTIRRVYRTSNELERISGDWTKKLPSVTRAEILEVSDLVEGHYSFLNLAVAAMEGRTVKAK